MAARGGEAGRAPAKSQRGLRGTATISSGGGVPAWGSELRGTGSIVCCNGLHVLPVKQGGRVSGVSQAGREW